MNDNSNVEVRKSTSPKTLLLQIKKLSKGAQFYWYLTLVSTLWFTALCMINSTFRGTTSPITIRYYSLSLLSILITYLIILRQTYKNKPIAYFVGQLWHLIEHLLVRSSKKNNDSGNNNNNENNENNTNSKRNNNKNDKNNTNTNTNNNSESNAGTSTDVNKNKSSTNVNILRDENVQYLLFAFSHWLFATSLFGAINPSTLYPFAIYAIFHASQYTQSSIIPYLPYLSSSTKQKWCSNIIHFNRLFNERSRMLASNTEVLLVTFYIGPLIKIFFKIALGRFWRSSSGGTAQFRYDLKSVILFIITVAFLRARYTVDNYTRSQIQNYDAQINRLVWHPLIPQPIRQVLMGLRKVIGDFVEMFNIF